MAKNKTKLRTLKNRYFAVRHGESQGNIEKRVVSGMEYGYSNFYGLTQKGINQVVNSVTNFLQHTFLKGNEVVVINSPFSRTRETATIVAGMLRAEIVFSDLRLKERWFGDFEMKTPSHKLYERVWTQDKKDPLHTKWGVQSAQAVADECLSLILACEENFSSKIIFLVSHGDRLQIMQTVFEGTPPSLHRSLSHLDTAEIRELKLPR